MSPRVDVTSSLPPYAHLDQEAVQCVAQASSRYQVPELLLHAVLLKENGRTGQCSRPNGNGSRDCGLAQVNSVWRTYFEKQGVPSEALVHDACVNIQASAYILRTYFIQKDQDWFKAVMAYNIGPNRWEKSPNRTQIAVRYAEDVVRRWWGLYDWVMRQRAESTGSRYTNRQVPQPGSFTQTQPGAIQQ